MRLFELYPQPNVTPSTIRTARKNVCLYVDNEEFPTKLDKSFDILMTIPAYQYTGTMYRIMGFRAETFKVPDSRLILTKLHEYVQRHPRQVVSWSQTISGIKHFVNVVGFENNGVGEPEYKRPAGFVLEQESVGLLPERVCTGQWDTGFADSEQEVLARYSNNVHVAAWWVSIDGKMEFFDATNFNTFVRAVRNYYHT